MAIQAVTKKLYNKLSEMFELPTHAVHVEIILDLNDAPRVKAEYLADDPTEPYSQFTKEEEWIEGDYVLIEKDEYERLKETACIRPKRQAEVLAQYKYEDELEAFENRNKPQATDGDK